MNSPKRHVGCSDTTLVLPLKTRPRVPATPKPNTGHEPLNGLQVPLM